MRASQTKMFKIDYVSEVSDHIDVILTVGGSRSGWWYSQTIWTAVRSVPNIGSRTQSGNGGDGGMSEGQKKCPFMCTQ